MAKSADASIPSADAMAAAMVQGAQAAGQKWQDNTAASVADAISGAINASDVYATGVQAAIANGSYVKGLRKVDTNALAAQIKAAGSTAYTSGISTRQPKITAAFTKWRPNLVTQTDAVRAMPNKTPSQRDQRALAMIQGLRAKGVTNRNS